MNTCPNLYIETLILKNFATFEFQEIRFDQQFNAIIGETGAGKSLILDALQIILGQRADKKLIRKGHEFALIEATFACTDKKVKGYFESIGHPMDADSEVISIKRMIYSSGKNKSFLNYIPCNINTLIDFSRNFVDLVGQFENQKLLTDEYQLQLIDSYGKLDELQRNYVKEFRVYKGLQQELRKYQSDESVRTQKIDFLKFQIQEVSKLDPSIEDEDELLQQKKDYQVWEKKHKVLQDLNNLLSTNDPYHDILGNLKKSIQLGHKNPEYIPAELTSKLDEAYALLEESSFQINKELDSEVSDQQMGPILERLDLYQRLKKKYGGNTESLVARYEEMQTELDTLVNLDERIDDITHQLQEQKDKTWKLAKEVLKLRNIKAKEISEKLTRIVHELKMEGAVITMTLEEKTDLDETGLGQVQFMAETNPGEGLFRIKDIASGGELSRILLAFRQVLSAKDTISIFLFDEIEAGIGGETALQIGKSLSKVAQSSQVVAITHLPQIAHYASKLIVVTKESLLDNNNTRTKSAIKEVTGTGKKEEIQNMVPLN